MRPYELMIICVGDLDDSAFQKQADWLESQLAEVGAEVAKVDRWGRRRFAYEIDHRLEGYYAVYELLAEPGALDSVERNMRLSDDFVRHMLLRLPDHEAERRGMFGGVPAADAADSDDTTTPAPATTSNDADDAADDSPEATEEVSA